MTEEERQAIVDEITQNVLTALSQNAIDWSANKIEFTSPSAITVATREKVLVPAIDTRENKRIYGNLDLNTLLSAYGLQEAKKVIDIVENTGDVVVGELAAAKTEAIAEIDSKTEAEKAELSTHSEAEKGTISSATSNAISSIQQAKDFANDEVSATATTKKNELDAIVATGISKIEQTTTSTEDDGENVITVTLINGTKYTFKVQNGSKGSKGDKGDTGDVSNVYSKTEIDSLLSSKVNKTDSIDATSVGGLSLADGTYQRNRIVNVRGDGVSEVGKYFDFHESDGDADYSVRLTSSSGALNCSGTFTATKVYNAVFS